MTTINPLVVDDSVDMAVRRAEFLEWMQEAPTIEYRNDEGAKLELLSPRRGNLPYVRRQRRRYKRLLDRLGNELYTPLSDPTRPHLACTHDFFITFTYDHNIYTIDECNARVSDDLKKMRTYLHRIFDSKFGTIVCYESSKSGYPAPHIILRLDKSVEVFSHLSKKNGKRSWRLKNNDTRLIIQAAWNTCGGGHCDIKGIVAEHYEDMSRQISYAFKYLTKTVTGRGKGAIKDPVTALNTLANNRAFHRGTVYISPAFIARIEDPPLSRLDILRTKLQQARNRICVLKRRITKHPEQKPQIDRMIARLAFAAAVIQSHLPPPEWHFTQSIPAWIIRQRKKGIADAPTA